MDSLVYLTAVVTFTLPKPSFDHWARYIHFNHYFLSCLGCCHCCLRLFLSLPLSQQLIFRSLFCRLLRLFDCGLFVFIFIFVVATGLRGALVQCSGSAVAVQW